MKWLLRGDVPGNKITPLYLPKRRMFSLEWVRASLWSKTSMQVAIFSFGEDSQIHFSGLGARQFP